MFKNLEKPPSITVTPFGNGDIRDSKWIDWRGGGWCTFSLSRVFCKISRGKYFAFHPFISLSLSLSLLRIPSFFPRVVFRCFKLSAAPACIRVLPLARSIAGKKIGGKIVKKGRGGEREVRHPPRASRERERSFSRRCFPSCRTSHVLSHASYN